MTHAFAIGYDWLYNALSPEERATIREAIVTKAMDPVLPVYQKPNAWSRDRLHWNLVCNAGFAMGALAVAEDVSEKSAVLLRAILDSVPHGLQSFGAEGAWPEGPAYGEYAMRYACLLFASLGTAVGSDYGLSGTRGFDRAGRYRVYTTGPANRTFSFAAAPDDPDSTPELFWMSRRFASPVLAWSEQKQAEAIPRADGLDLAWFERDAKQPQPPAWPLDIVFRSVQLATFRSSWKTLTHFTFRSRAAITSRPARISISAALRSMPATCVGRSIRTSVTASHLPRFQARPPGSAPLPTTLC